MDERKRKSGFALLTPEQRKEIARKGGRAAQKRGRAHQFGSDDAREAGKKGGAKVSQDRAHMARIGAKGGRVRPSERQTLRNEEEE
jgi:general stress protein YciG